MLLAALLTAALQDPTPPDFVPARVGSDSILVRSFYHDSMPSILTLDPGMPVRIVVTREPWARIQVPGGFVVWVYGVYVDVAEDGVHGILNEEHVRARPIPSTAGAEAHPVGVFSFGDPVLIFEEQDGWLKVRAPESLGAWTPLAGLEPLNSLPANWQALWEEEASVVPMPRLPEPLPVAAAPVTEEVSVAEVQETGIAAAEEFAGTDALIPGTETPVARVVVPIAVVEATTTVGEEPVAIAAVVPRDAPVVAEAATSLLDSPAPPTFLDSLAAADLDLASLDPNHWNEGLASEIEGIYTAVLWTADSALLVERARVGLDQLEARRLVTQSPPTVTVHTPPEPAYLLVGTLAWDPAFYSAVPWSIHTGDQTISVLSRDGRLNLADFRGHEVAVHGVWRKSAKRGHRVLEIDRLRLVLPPALAGS